MRLLKNTLIKLTNTVDNPELITMCQQQKHIVFEHYENRNFSEAVRAIMGLADRVNQYVSDKAPWTLAKQEETKEQAWQVLTTTVNCFDYGYYLYPIIPKL